MVCSKTELTVLSFGGGQESTALLYLLLFDEAFRKKWAPGLLVVLGCDTGDEHPETYEHVRYCAELCLLHRVPFFWATAFPENFGNADWAVAGFQSEAWKSLTHQYRRNSSFGSKLFSRTCTDNLKIGVFYRALAWCVDGWTGNRLSKLSPQLTFNRWMREGNNRIRVMIGFAKGEERRREKTLASVTRTGPGSLPQWRRESFEMVFPLIDDPATNWDRAQSQAYMRQANLPVPVPSNCLRCHFRGPVELLWLARRHPEKLKEWEAIEQAKIEKYRAQGKPDEENNYVFGKKPIRDVLAAAEKKHGHMTDEQLEEYRMSHGHCVANGF